MNRTILPARPLRLRAGAYMKSALLALLMLVFAGLLGLATAWVSGGARTIGRDKDVWASGVPAQDGTINGKRSSKLGLSWLIASYDFTVSYVDAEGARYEGKLEFWTMFGGPDVDEQAEVRYDPKRPERFAVSWGVEASGARWRAVIVLTALCGLTTLLFAWLAWVMVQDGRALARTAAGGDELQLRVIAETPIVKDGKATGKWRFELERDDGSGTRRTIIKEQSSVLHCAPNNARVLALWTPGQPSSIVVPTRDLAPLAVSDAERREIVGRAEQTAA